MAVTKRANFVESEAGVRVARILAQMVQDDMYGTESSYSADAATYPDNLMPFVDKHMKYLTAHPNVNPDHYISNLRLVTRTTRR